MVCDRANRPHPLAYPSSFSDLSSILVEVAVDDFGWSIDVPLPEAFLNGRAKRPLNR